MHGLDGIDKESQEHQVRFRSFTRREQIYTRVGGHAPVIMFAIPVDTGKWFFMQKSTEFMTPGQPVQNIHQKGIIIYSHTDFFKYRCTLELGGGHFIMACL